MSDTDWTPVAHEDIEDDEPAPTPAKPKPTAKAQPITLAIAAPPELIDAITDLADAMREQTKALTAVLKRDSIPNNTDS